MADESIIFDTKIDNRGFQAGIKNLGNGLGKIKNALLGVASATQDAFGDKAQSSVSTMKSELKGVNEEIKETEKSQKGLAAQHEKAVQALNEMRAPTEKGGLGFKESQLTEQIAEVDRLAEALRPGDERLESLRNRANELKQSIADAGNAAKKTGKQMDEAMNQKPVSRFATALKGILSGFKNVGSFAWNTFKKISNGAWSAFKTVGSAAWNGFKKVGSAITGAIGRLKLFNKESRRSGNAVTDFGKRIKNLIVAAFVFNVIRKGLSELRQYMGGLLKTNSEFAASLTSIKVNLMTAFQPIFEAILPALNALMSALATATAYVAAFISMLFGKTYAESRAAAKALNQQSDALKKTGKAAKDAAGFLASFDQINKAAADTSAGADDEGAAALFEEAEMPEMDLSWLETLKQKLQELIPDLDYFNNLGKLLAQKIIDALNGIKWDKIKRRARSVAAKLASFLNGFLANPTLWAAIGRTLAEGLNTALEFLNEFARIFDWSGFGQAFAAGINSFFETFDWALLGETISLWAIGLLTAIDEAIKNTDWVLIGASIRETLVNIDWQGIMDKLVEVALDGLGAALKAALGLFAADINQEAIDRIDASIENLKRSVSGFTTKVGEGIRWFIDNILSPLMEWTISEAIPAFFDLLSGAIDALNAIIDAAKPALQWLWDEILQPMAEWTGDLIIQALGWLTDRFRAISNWIKENEPHVTNFIKIVGLLALGFIAAEGAVMLVHGAFIVLEGLFAILTSPAGVFILVVAAIAAIVTAAGNAGEMIDTLKSIFKGFGDFISGVFTGDWEKAWDGIKSIFKGVFNGIVIILESAINLIIRGINWMIDKINTISLPVPDWITDMFGITTIGFNIPNISEIALPRLAQGGLIQPNNPRMVIVGDNTREEEIVSPRSAIREEARAAVIEAIEEMGGLGGSGTMEVVLEVDSVVLGRTIVDLGDKTRRRMGVRIKPVGALT